MKKRLNILGVIGDPISHSLSPLIHNAALAKLKLPYLYMPFHIKKNEIKRFLGSLEKRNIAGINVTIPHKQSVIPFMHSLSKEAKLIGAVNTIIRKGARLFGDNTDGRGYLLSLKKEAGFSIKGKKVILLGAGGAARAISVVLGLNGAHTVFIHNKPEWMASNLKKELEIKFPKTIFHSTSLTKIDLQYWEKADLLINSSAMGMKGIPLVPLPLSKLPRRTLISDIVYNPLESPLLKRAKKLKLKTHPGWGMFLYQGALSFEMWTGKKAPVKVMRKYLLEALK